MPELPEVETVVRFIRPVIVGKIINNVQPQNEYTKVLATHNVQRFNHFIEGRTVEGVERR